MAKKSKKSSKPVRKPMNKPKKKAAAKTARKAAPKRPAARKSGGARTPAALKPFPVKTGRGATPAEVGAGLVAMFNRGELAEIEEKWWSPKIVSCEGSASMEWRGLKAVHAKNAWWMQDHAMHGGSADGPYVGATGFAVKFRLEVETKSTGVRETMEEVAVYTVENGKIVREEFMGSAAAPEPVARPAPQTEPMMA